MARNILDEISRQYNSFTAPVRESPFRVTLTDRSYDVDLSRYRQALMNAQSRNVRQREENRSLLDRTLDALQVGLYPTMGAVRGFINKDLNPIEGFVGGLRAANPFGKGYQEGEHTFSRVLEDLGWEPETTAGKIVRGTAGFIGDVFLDPTTYLTGGLSAVVKGTGKVGAVAKGLERADAENIVREIGYKLGLSEDDLAKETDRFIGEYNRLYGINRSNPDGVNLSLGNIPFGDRIFGSLAQHKIKLADDDVVRAFGDKTIAPLYAKLRDRLYGSRIGKMFSTHAPIYNIAKDKPEELYRYIKHLDARRGIEGDKLKRDALIRDKAKAFDNLTPAEKKTVIEALENPMQWTKIREFIKIAETEEGVAHRQALSLERDRLVSQLTDLEWEMNRIRTRSSAVDEAIESSEAQLKRLEDEYQRRLMEFDTTFLTKKKEYEKIIDKLDKELARIDDEIFKIEEAQKVRKARLETLDEDFDESSIKKMTESEITSDAKAEFDKALDDLDLSPAFKFYEDFKFAEGIEKSQFERLFRETKRELDNMPTMDSNARTEYFNRKMQQFGDKNKAPRKRQELRAKLIEELNNALFGGERIIGIDVMDAKLDELYFLFKNGSSPRALRNHVYEDISYYSGFMSRVLSHVAFMMGNYGRGQRYKTWDEFFTKRYEKLADLAKKNRLDDRGRDLMIYLLQQEMRRKKLIAKYKRMSDEELASIMAKERTDRLADDLARQGENMTHKEREEWLDDTRLERDAYDGGAYDEFRDDVKREVKGYTYSKAEARERHEYRLKQLFKDTTLSKQQEREYIYKRLFGEVGLVDDATEAVQVQVIEAIMDKLQGLRGRVRRIKGQQIDHLSFGDLERGHKSFLFNLALKEAREANPRLFDEAEPMFQKNNKPQKVKEISDEDYFKIGVYVRKYLGFKKSTITSAQKEIVEAIRAQYPRVMAFITKSDGEDISKKTYSQLNHAQKEEIFKVAQSMAKKENPDLFKAKKEPKKVKVKKAEKMSPLEARKKYYEDIDKIKSAREADLLTKLEKSKLNYLKAMEIYGDKLDNLGDKAKFQEMLDDYKRSIDMTRKNIAELNSKKEMLKSRVISEERYHQLQDEIRRIEEALDDDDALDTYMRMQFGDEAVDAVIEAWSPVARLAYRPDVPVEEKLVNIIEALRGEFMEMAEKEVAMNKLSKEQADAMLMSYLPRILLPDGAKFFSSRKGKEIVAKKPALTNDFGYGNKWNPYKSTRKIKRLKIGGKWVENPTVSQINEYFRPFLHGKNAFSEDIADIYLQRALKHSELIYDDEYMHNMLDVFGQPVKMGDDIEDGFKAVMNFGMLREYLRDSASLHVSMRISDEVSDFVREYYAINAFRTVTDDDVEFAIESFIKNNFTRERIKTISDEVNKYILRESGIPENVLSDAATPMVELSKEQRDKLFQLNHDLKIRADKYVNKRWQRAIEKQHPRLIEEAKAFREKVESLEPQIRKVNDAIVLKANQARKLQAAKDMSKFLQYYDKFLHLVKLNMTTIVPSFHMRNKLSNMFLNWLGVGREALNPALQKKAFQVIRSQGATKKNDIFVVMKDGEPVVYEWSELFEIAKSYGVIDEGFFAKDIGAESGMTGLIPFLPARLDPTDTENFILYKKGAEVGSLIENSDRFANFVARLKLGQSIDDAARGSRHDLFDYSDLTLFEQHVMKRLIPFYTWLRKNARLQISQILEQPEKYRTVAKITDAVNNMSDEDDMMDRRYVSNFAQDWIQTPFSFNNEFGRSERVLWNTNMPYNDLSRIFDPFNPISSSLEMFTQITPAIKVPLEQALNHDTFFDAPIAREGDNAAVKRINHVMRQNALYNAVQGFINREGLDKGLHTLSFFSGLKFLSYDYDAYRHQMIEEDAMKLGARGGEKFINFLQRGFTSFARSLEELIEDKFSFIPNEKMDELDRKEREVDSEIGGDNEWAYLDADTGIEEKLNALPGKYKEAEVIEITDGDTLKVRIGDTVESVRLLLVDTPETKKPDTPLMPYGIEAREHLQSLVDGKKVKLVFDAGERRDAYNRVLAFIHVDDVDVNKSLIESGYAKMTYLDAYSTRIKEYRAAERAAKSEGRGIWSMPGYTIQGDREGFRLDMVNKELFEELQKLDKRNR